MNIRLKRALIELRELGDLRRRLQQAGAGNFRAEKTRVTKKINAIWNSFSEEEREETLIAALGGLDRSGLQ